MSKWDELSMAEKAEMMKVAVRQGITNLSDIKQRYNEFAEGGSKVGEEEGITDEQYLNTMEKVAEENYKNWGYNNSDEALVHALNDNTYDYRGYYNNYPQSAANADTHWTDEFKTVYHPTFSNESVYSGQKSQYNPYGLTGGFWVDDSFFPMAWQMNEHQYKEGGHKIHIKPENRGKFTALKERTGHSATWFKEHGTPAQRKMATFALNSRKWKHGLGGNLFDGNSQPTQKMKISKPYYSYDENGRKIDDTLNYNISFPEVVIIPDSKKSPAERAILERERRASHDATYSKGTYDAARDKEWTALQQAVAQKAWENSAEKAALNYGQAIASGIGMGADIVSRLPIYSSLKGASTLSKAETPLDYAEGAMWLTPIVGATYQAAKPIAQKAANEAAIAWAFRNPEISNVFSDLHPVTKKTEINTSTNKPVFIRWGNDERFAVQPSAEVYNDIVNQLKDARSYRTSSGYKELVNRFTKQSRDKGIDFSESLFDGNNKFLSKLTVSNREAGHLGEYYPTTNSIDLDLAQIGDMPVPFHEGIHWQRIGFPADRIGPKFEKWLEARKAGTSNEMQLFEEFRSSPEYTRYYQRKAADKAIQDKVDEALYSFADETLRNKGELQAYGLEAGKAIGIQPFSEYPGMIDALDAIEKARKYSPQLRDVKSGGEKNVRRFWDILTGNYVPVTLPIALGSYKYTSKNK